jgi:hypothetical protein
VNRGRQSNFDPIASDTCIRADIGVGLDVGLYTDEAHLGTEVEDGKQRLCEMLFAFPTVQVFGKKNNPPLSHLEPRAAIE